MSKQVKSAVRVIKVLEFFDRIRRPAGVTEIAQALGFPASSTSGLLYSLVELGYLAQDADRMYRPTPRITLLGAWIAPQLAPDGPVLSVMRELGAATGETIILGAPCGLFVRYIHVVPATKPLRVHVGPGDIRPLVQSGIGRMLLALMEEDEVRQTVFRHNAAQSGDATRISYATLRRDLEGIRAAGYSVSVDRITKGAGLVSLALPGSTEVSPMAIAVAGPSNTIRSRCEEIAQRMADTVHRHLGPVNSSPRKAFR